MSKISFILCLFMAFPINVFAQFTDFPAGYSAVPKTKMKGAVHTVLTIQQRGEHVFETEVEVYDRNGRLIESLSSNASIETHSDKLVRLGGKSTFAYDTAGKLIRAKHFTPEGENWGYRDYIYDKESRLVEDISYARGKEDWRTTYTYFPEKREVEVKWSGIKILLSYNEKNQWTKRTRYDSNGTADRQITFEYDAQGNLTKESHGSYWHNYSYKFDKQGNWIERQNDYFQFGKNGKEEVNPDWMRTYRVITYYSDSETKP